MRDKTGFGNLYAPYVVWRMRHCFIYSLNKLSLEMLHLGVNGGLIWEFVVFLQCRICLTCFYPSDVSRKFGVGLDKFQFFIASFFYRVWSSRNNGVHGGQRELGFFVKTSNSFVERICGSQGFLFDWLC